MDRDDVRRYKFLHFMTQFWLLLKLPSNEKSLRYYYTINRTKQDLLKVANWEIYDAHISYDFSWESWARVNDGAKEKVYKRTMR